VSKFNILYETIINEIKDTNNKVVSFIGIKGKYLPPTRNHRPAIYEDMLGTVNAVNDEGKVEYFDYNYEDAIKYAGISEDRDIRIYKYKKPKFYSNKWSNILRDGQKVLWILK